MTPRNTTASGSTTKCMAKDILYGPMANNILENFLKIKDTGKENSFGKMDENTKDPGFVASKME